MQETVLIIPVYGNPQTTQKCLDSLFKYAKENPPFVVVAIDDGNDNITKHCLESYSVQLLTNDQNRGYIYSINRGIRFAMEQLNAENIVLMNNDLEFNGAWLKGMLEYTEKYDIVGYFGRKKLKMRKHVKTLYLEFSCALIKRQVFKNVGVLDPIYRSGYLSDDDFCLRSIMNNYKLVQINRGVPPKIVHYHGQTFGVEERYRRMQEEYHTFIKRWGPKRSTPIVNSYFKKYIFNPFTLTYGEQSKFQTNIKKYILWKQLKIIINRST